MESSGGWPMNNKKVQLRWTQNCAGGSHRTKLHFLESGVNYFLLGYIFL